MKSCEPDKTIKPDKSGELENSGEPDKYSESDKSSGPDKSSVRIWCIWQKYSAILFVHVINFFQPACCEKNSLDKITDIKIHFTITTEWLLPHDGKSIYL